MMYTNKPKMYNPEIREYLELCGFQKTSDDSLPGGMMFFDANCEVSVQMWGNKVQVSRYNGFTWNTVGNYVGFDGQNLPHFMMLMHIMNAIDLNHVKARSDEELKEAINLMKKPARHRAACIN